MQWYLHLWWYFLMIATNLLTRTTLNTTQPFQYKIAESPIPSAEEESSSEDEEDGPRKPKVDPDDPVARKSKLVYKHQRLNVSLTSKHSLKLLLLIIPGMETNIVLPWEQ